MKRIATTLSMLLLLGFLFQAGTADAYASANQKAGIQVRTAQYSSTQQPGGYVSVRVGIYNTQFADKKGLRSAVITISYDEKVFEASDDLLRYDEKLGKHVWRDDAFEKDTEWIDATDTWAGLIDFEDFSVTNPYPLDLDPTDGRKEIRFEAVITGDRYFTTKTLDPEDFLSFNLKVKTDAPLKKSAITVVTKESVLRDSANSAVNSFYYKSAHLSIEKPVSLSIAQGNKTPTTDPLTLHVGKFTLLTARANYSNGDYVRVSGTFTSSDQSVVAITSDGELDTKGLGSAWITFTSGELTTKKRVDVVADSVSIPPVTENYYGFMYKDPYIDDQQILINGEDAGLGRMIDGSIYAPLKTIAIVLGGNVGYDGVKKVPTLNEKAVTQFKVVGQTTYFKLADLRTLADASLTWNKKDKILLITTKTLD